MQRQKYKDIDISQAHLYGDIFQIKYDGIWCRIEIENGIAELFSRTNRSRKMLTVPNAPNCILIGEYMFGSQRAQSPRYKNKIFLFDCVQYKNQDLSSLPYKERYARLKVLLNYLTEPFCLVKNYSVMGVEKAWDVLKDMDEEGIVLRKLNDTYGSVLARCKYTVEMIFYAVDFHRGQGKYANTLGAISVAKSPNAPPLMKVGGGFSDAQRHEIWENSDYYFGRSVEIIGKGVFESGALRHPNFNKWL